MKNTIALTNNTYTVGDSVYYNAYRGLTLVPVQGNITHINKGLPYFTIINTCGNYEDVHKSKVMHDFPTN